MAEEATVGSVAADIIKGGAIVILSGAGFIVVVKVAEALLALL